SGKYGSIRRICASDNNSKSLIAGILSIRMNQSHCADASYLMGPEPRENAWFSRELECQGIYSASINYPLRGAGLGPVFLRSWQALAARLPWT
ncbi:hypothetical protein, partial [Rhizobium leguminosarum]|uniref:hypothetical protein n=1 Tax=Rhizobium leguminosarum TaxID=384 RepID=UPI001AEC2E2F